MTTIAYRDGVLAADSLSTSEGLVRSRVVKIRRLKDSVIALMGSSSGAKAIADWMAGDRSDEQPSPNHGGAVVEARSDGSIYVYEDGACEPDGDAPFYAWGCGAPIAIGAMAHGATAEEAVRIACEWDTCTGGDVTALRVGEGAKSDDINVGDLVFETIDGGSMRARVVTPIAGTDQFLVRFLKAEKEFMFGKGYCVFSRAALTKVSA